MADETATESTNWMSDVQRVLAIVLVGTFAVVLLLFGVRLVIWGDAPTLVDLLKTLISALINVVMLVLGYFYGSSKAKEQSDSSQQRVVEKLTSAPPNGPVAPVPSPTTAADVAWWNKMTDAERAAILSAAGADPSDTKLSAIVSGPVKMKPDPDEIAHLVSKGLLTQARATAIQTS